MMHYSLHVAMKGRQVSKVSDFLCNLMRTQTLAPVGRRKHSSTFLPTESSQRRSNQTVCQAVLTTMGPCMRYSEVELQVTRSLSTHNSGGWQVWGQGLEEVGVQSRLQGRVHALHAGSVKPKAHVQEAKVSCLESLRRRPQDPLNLHLRSL